MLDRLFTLDAQFIFDAVVLGLSMLVLFCLLSYLFFDPVREILEKRQKSVRQEQEKTKRDREEAAVYKDTYEQKLRETDNAVGQILGESKRRAKESEKKILNEAKQEAGRIISHAREDAALEKMRVADEARQEMILTASALAKKVLAAAIHSDLQEDLIDRALEEMGEDTWRG